MFGPPSTSMPSIVPVSSSTSTPLTEVHCNTRKSINITVFIQEQRRKIAENRLKAMELRAKKEADERNRLEKERIEKEERENIHPDIQMDEPNIEDIPDLDEDDIMAQFDDFE